MLPIQDLTSFHKWIDAKVSMFESQDVPEPLDVVDASEGEVVLGILTSQNNQRLYAVARQICQQLNNLEKELQGKAKKQAPHTTEHDPHTCELCCGARKQTLLKHELEVVTQILWFIVYQGLSEEARIVYSGPEFGAMGFRGDWKIVAIPRKPGPRIIGVIELGRSEE